MKRDPTFRSEQFTATKSAIAEDKAKWANAMISWIMRGFPEKGWRKSLYHPLSNLFGHIAHYHLHGFYAEWFADTRCQLAWLEYVAAGGIYGNMHCDPAHTWSDVEHMLSVWVRTSGVLDRYKNLGAPGGKLVERTQQAAKW